MRYPVGRAALVFGVLPALALADKVLELKVVSFSDGDPGPRKSNQCGGEVVGREIDATGVKPGKQVLKLKVIVRRAGYADRHRRAALRGGLRLVAPRLGRESVRADAALSNEARDVAPEKVP